MTHSKTVGVFALAACLLWVGVDLFAQQAAPATLATDAAWTRASPSFEWSFPRDHWPHRGYKTEWWYFTGHLENAADPAERFGYQFTIFRVGLSPTPQDVDSDWAASSLLMGHASLTDIRGERHRFSEVLYREVPHLASFEDEVGRRIATTLGPPGTATAWTLDWEDEAFSIRMADERQGWALELRAEPERGMTLHGDGGYSRKSATSESASHYYSFTRLKTSGSLRIEGRDLEVQGRSWMDKEFSSDHIDPKQVGWDWMSLQFDDGTDWMLFQLRDGKGASDFTSATQVTEANKPEIFENTGLRMEPRRRWQSSSTKASYPVEWRVELPDGRQIDVIAVLDEQENIGASGIFYWEGVVEVREGGEVVGRGYLEMTGYGENSRPPI